MAGIAVVGLAAMIGVEAADGAAGAAERAGVRQAAGRSLSHPRHTGPGGPMPEVVLTARTQESRAVEARLAAFVRAVRRRDGARAARFLSRETAPSVRTAVARREWPWRTAPEDLGPLFSLKGLRLRTVALRMDRARVRIGPQRVSRDSVEAVGFYDVGMVHEGRWWQVTLPASARGGRRATGRSETPGGG